MSTHEHEHYRSEPPVHDDYGPPDPEELALTTPDHPTENLDQETVSERGDLVPPKAPVEELDEQLVPDIDGPDAGFPELDEGAEGVPEALKARTARTTSRPVGRQVGRGVEWVRPTDLMARRGATVAGRGIHFQTALSQKTRHGITVGARRVGDRAGRLAPLSAFGRGQAQSVPGRSAVGMS
ncbi:hypothetical protein [Dermabacter jinjuensis]|uniref:Uncharacterized protein n=1 Tax=Dermabacter jinjuensis TaxID=1667168 RepID=A0ABM6PPT3_9MICO|nr:hypothetical protein [Dermabacter jinjuensis]ATH97416.1 hypothetical protein COP05_10310 [Dermabacter jinjuensis]UEB89617.1 hypothetical protein LK448_08995 [Dermabacter jinjuensis]